MKISMWKYNSHGVSHVKWSAIMLLFGQRRVLKKATNSVLCPKEEVVGLKARKKLQGIG
jgi:hypothetical protein